MREGQTGPRTWRCPAKSRTKAGGHRLLTVVAQLSTCEFTELGEGCCQWLRPKIGGEHYRVQMGWHDDKGIDS